ncbi:MAG TPA: RNA methyltransferase [Accumulibacter sp.]|nr:RNA methyltransferase [Accumulibacter sp.]HMW16443.1 RNA methyltransferase [Accumulibacter sp.]HMX21406.1 RNA methyltransferase [Accumulibacter sp.]HMY07456.1 RNA methyltransferase [Accumulibacter sp.]HNC16673.1 RNA methyltransferase [Accumulibacter sp.]
MKFLTSRDNPHFKALRKLVHRGQQRRQSGLAVLDGLHLVESCCQHCSSPSEVIVSESGARREEIVAWLAAAGPSMRIVSLTDALFNELSVVDTPSGIMAVIQPPTPSPLDIAADCLLLDGIQDPGNLGSMLRSAAAAGFSQVLLSDDCAQAWSPKTLRAAMGAHFVLSIHETVDLPAFMARYRGQMLATASAAAQNLFAADLGTPLAWIFGSEGQGIRPAVLAASSGQIRIPMSAAMESLNVAAAAAICLFETCRQRQTSGKALSTGMQAAIA